MRTPVPATEPRRLTLKEQQQRLREDVILQAVNGLLADKGYDERMGARPLARVIQEHIKKPLAEELLFGKLVHGGRVTIDLDENEKIKLSYEEPASTPAIPSAI